MKKIIISFLSVLLLNSCTASDSSGFLWLVILFVVLLFMFSFSVYLLVKRRRRANSTLANFSADVKKMTDKFENPNDKIKVLRQLIERIEKDEKYKKTPDWKNSVLVRVYEHIGAIYYESGNEDGIIEICTDIISLDPANGMAYYNRGSLYNNRGEYEKALKDFNDAAIVIPNYSNLYNNRGLVYERLGKYENALADYNTAIELEPTAIIYYNRANLHYENEKYSEAKEDYRKYLEYDPKNKDGLKEYVERALELINIKLNK